MQDRMADQAAAWIARLRADDCSEQDRADFALWLAANPEHRRSMDSMLEMWEDLGASGLMPQQWSDHSNTRRSWIMGAATLAAGLVLALTLIPQLSPPSEQQQFQTRLGEQLVVDLSDGSQITLNTDSKLRVDLQTHQRKVELSRGEAYFNVARDAQRPFIVLAGNAEVRALGTAFNIYVHDGESHISVTEGVVRVTELNAPPSRVPDTALLYADQGIASKPAGLASLSVSNTTSVIAWRNGQIIADGMQLNQLVQELSRYHPQRIIIPDPELGQKTVSGVFQLEDPETILRALEHSFDVRSVALADGSVQLIKAPL
jgi:transmembrane sensor